MHSQATILLLLSVVGTVLLSACQVVPAPRATVTAAAPDRVVGEIAAREIARRQQEARESEAKATLALNRIQKGEIEAGVLELERAYAAFPNAPVLAARRQTLRSLRDRHLCDYAESLVKIGRRDEARAILLRVSAKH